MSRDDPTKVSNEQFNGGVNYADGRNMVSGREMDAVVEGVLWAEKHAEAAESLAINQPNIDDIAFGGEPSVEIEPVTGGVGYRFKFSGISGVSGKDGKSTTVLKRYLTSMTYGEFISLVSSGTITVQQIIGAADLKEDDYAIAGYGLSDIAKGNGYGFVIGQISSIDVSSGSVILNNYGYWTTGLDASETLVAGNNITLVKNSDGTLTISSTSGGGGGEGVQSVNGKSPDEAGNITLTKSDIELGNVENKPMDSAPADGSGNYISSGGVYKAIQDAITTALNTAV